MSHNYQRSRLHPYQYSADSFRRTHSSDRHQSKQGYNSHRHHFSKDLSTTYTSRNSFAPIFGKRNSSSSSYSSSSSSNGSSSSVMHQEDSNEQSSLPSTPQISPESTSSSPPPPIPFRTDPSNTAASSSPSSSQSDRNFWYPPANDEVTPGQLPPPPSPPVIGHQPSESYSSSDQEQGDVKNMAHLLYRLSQGNRNSYDPQFSENLTHLSQQYQIPNQSFAQMASYLSQYDQRNEMNLNTDESSFQGMSAEQQRVMMNRLQQQTPSGYDVHEILREMPPPETVNFTEINNNNKNNNNINYNNNYNNENKSNEINNEIINSKNIPKPNINQFPPSCSQFSRFSFTTSPSSSHHPSSHHSHDLSLSNIQTSHNDRPQKRHSQEPPQHMQLQQHQSQIPLSEQRRILQPPSLQMRQNNVDSLVQEHSVPPSNVSHHGNKQRYIHGPQSMDISSPESHASTIPFPLNHQDQNYIGQSSQISPSGFSSLSSSSSSSSSIVNANATNSNFKPHHSLSSSPDPLPTSSYESFGLSERGGKGTESQEGILLETDDDRARLVWTPELHDRFETAVNYLGGIWRSTPKAIQYLMNVQGLTKEHIKSHLQKYRRARKKEGKAPQIEEKASKLSKKSLDEMRLPVAQLQRRGGRLTVAPFHGEGGEVDVSEESVRWMLAGFKIGLRVGMKVGNTSSSDIPPFQKSEGRNGDDNNNGRGGIL